jgi:hypothetical protein
MFHGNPKTGIVAQVHQVVNGLAPFDKMYTSKTDQVVCANVDATSKGSSLVLKAELSRSETVIIAGRDITQSVLERTTFTKPLLMKGRKLFNDANIALKNIRKALGVLKDVPGIDFVNDKIQYRSRVSEEEVKEKLLDLMHELLKGKTSVDDKTDVTDLLAEDDEDINHNEENIEENNNNDEQDDQPAPLVRPPGWFFQGWMAFLLFGPFAEPSDRLDLFQIGSHPDDGKGASSRKAMRKDAAELKDKQRLAGISKRYDDAVRGIAQVTQVNIDFCSKEISIRELEVSNNQREGIMLNLHIQLASLNKVQERTEKRAMSCTDGFDISHFMWKKVIEIENEIDEINASMKAIMDNMMVGQFKSKRARIEENGTVATAKSKATNSTLQSVIDCDLDASPNTTTLISPTMPQVINCTNSYEDESNTSHDQFDHGSTMVNV